MYIYNICKYVWIWSEFQRGDKIKSKWEHQLHDTSHIRVQMHKATNKVRCIRYVSIFSTVLSGNDTARFFFSLLWVFLHPSLKISPLGFVFSFFAPQRQVTWYASWHHDLTRSHHHHKNHPCYCKGEYHIQGFLSARDTMMLHSRSH